MGYKKSKKEEEYSSWSTLGWVLWAKPDEKLPQDVFDENEKCRLGWNYLVDLMKLTIKNYNLNLAQISSDILYLEKDIEKESEILEKAIFVFKEAKMRKESVESAKEVKDKILSSLKEKRRLLYKKRKEVALEQKLPSFSKHLKTVFYPRNTYALLTKELGVYPMDAEGVSAKFYVTLESYFSNSGTGAGLPRYKDAFDKKMGFYHRWNEPHSTLGVSFGKEGRKLFNTPKAKTKLSIEPPSEKGRSYFYWNFHGKKVRFKTILHRPFPENFVVKQARLIFDGAKWRLALTIRFPQSLSNTRPSGDKTLVFFPKWTIDDTHQDIIIGMLSDNKNAINIRLFEDVDSHKTPTKYSLLDRIKYKEELQRRASLVLEEAKKDIIPYKDDIKYCIKWDKDIVRCGSKSLYELLRMFECAYQDKDSTHPVIHMLKSKLRVHKKLISEIKGVESRLIKHRDHCYWNFADKLCSQASTIYLHKISLKELGVRPDVDTIPEDVASSIKRNMRLAAHADLYQKIKFQAIKHGVKVEEFSKERKDNG